MRSSLAIFFLDNEPAYPALCWLHLTIEAKRTVLLAGVLSAILVAVATVYGNHEELTLPTLLHWFIVYAGSVGIYKGLAQTQSTTTTTVGGNPPVMQTTTAPTGSDTAAKPIVFPVITQKTPDTDSHLRSSDISNISAPH